MKFARSTSILVVACAAALPLVFAHCGGDDGSSPEVKADASSQDGTTADSNPEADAAHDSSVADGSSGGDTSNDTAAGDAMDGGTASDGDAFDAGDGFDGYTPGPPCDASDQCGDAGGQCCSGNCSNVAVDPHNCGSCGNACVTDQFCTGMTCEGAVFSNLCANVTGTVMLDEYATDDDAGALMGTSLAANCNPAVAVTAVSQDAGIAIDPVTGRPIAGPGDTLVIGGGSYGQITMGYLDSAGLTKVYLATDGPNNLAFYVRSTNVEIITEPYTSLTASHDVFVLELTVEPISGTLSYTGYGMFAPGTAAAGYFFANVVMPNIGTYTNAWYVYEWTDSGDVDGGAVQLPDSTDTFTLTMSGQ